MWHKNIKFPRFCGQRSSLIVVCLMFCLSGFSLYGQKTKVKKVKPKTPKASAAQNKNQIKQINQSGKLKLTLSPAAMIRSDAENPGVEENPTARLDWFLFQRSYPSNIIPIQKRDNEFRLLQQRQMRLKNLGLAEDSARWIPLGPMPIVPNQPSMGPTSGRVNTIAISPVDDRIVLVGGATGGIWRSTDGGRTFTPVSDNQTDLAIGAIAFSKSNPMIVYAGMGDAKVGYLGSGVLRSINGGQTWTKVNNQTLPSPGTVSDLLVDPINPQKVFLAQYTYRDAASSTKFRSGFYLSTDGGVNWRRTKSGLPTDLAAHPTKPNVLYLAIYGATSQDNQTANGVLRSTDSGETWNLIFRSKTPVENIKIATTPAAPDSIYVYSGDSSGAELSISRDGGTNWTERKLSNIDTGQFFYNCYIEVDPTDSKAIYLGSRDLFKSIDGGATWMNLTNNWYFLNNRWNFSTKNSASHSDQHAIAISKSNPKLVIIGNDGGVSKSTDAGQRFESLNSTLSLSQLNSISPHPTNPNVSCSGTQDNGALLRLNNSNQWKEFITGDSGNCYIVRLGNEEYYFTSYIQGFLLRFNSQSGYYDYIGTNGKFGENGPRPRIGFYPAFALNRTNGTLYFGSWKLFVSQDRGANWNETSATPNQDLTKGGTDVLTAIASGSAAEIIYTGSAQGRVMRSKDGGKTWQDVTLGLPDRFIKTIVIDPKNSEVAFVTVSGFGSGHVFKTTNGGNSWKDISGNLGDIPVNALLIDPVKPNLVYLGTDLGVYRSTTAGINWTYFSQGMPPVIVTGFAATSPDSRIQVSTYGRGVFELVR